ncbi:MAG: hypothetical protein RL160_146 [Bacteroidota bacterium]|jgi:hypothetical protein
MNAVSLVVLLLMGFTSCKENPETFAIHTPISPGSSERVTYRLNKLTGSVDQVKLFTRVSTIDSSGNVTSMGRETLANTWNSPSFPIELQSPVGGYGANRLVQYRFEVKGNDKTYNHRVTFATTPYPVANAAIPVYVVGDQNKVFNIVFIPDTSMTSRPDLFKSTVASQIDSTFHQEDWIRRLRNSYNFFINPVSAIARDFNTGMRHVPPSNDANLSFAQGRCILHFHDIRDQSGAGYFSAEYYVRGTMLHESGHALYRLSDEYDNSTTLRQTDPNPNIWDEEADAEAAAPSYGKSSADVRQLGTQDWYRLCNNSCPMRSSGPPINHHDNPCKTRILYTLLQRAGN